MVELGNKHECLSCGTKFYDFGKTQLICPSCDADQAELAAESGDATKAKGSKTKKSTKSKKAKAKPKAKGKAVKKISDDSDKE